MGDNRKAWTSAEDHAIVTLVKKHGTHRWSEISKRMLDHFGPPGRTGKQCRERWHNNLNPKINKSDWTQDEERELFKCHEKFGNKWKVIAQHLKGRTDNYIKNKFYSTMRKKLRKISKLLGVKNSTEQVKDIKPKVLSNIIDAASDDQEIKEVWGELSKLLFYCDDKKLARMVKGEERQKIQDLIYKINAVNAKYQERKQSEKGEPKQDTLHGAQSEDNPSLSRKPSRLSSLRKRRTNSIQKQNQPTDPSPAKRQESIPAQLGRQFLFDISLNPPDLSVCGGMGTPGSIRHASNLYNPIASPQGFYSGEFPRLTRSSSLYFGASPGLGYGYDLRDVKINYDLTNKQAYDGMVENMRIVMQMQQEARRE